MGCYPAGPRNGCIWQWRRPAQAGRQPGAVWLRLRTAMCRQPGPLAPAAQGGGRAGWQELRCPGTKCSRPCAGSQPGPPSAAAAHLRTHPHVSHVHVQAHQFPLLHQPVLSPGQCINVPLCVCMRLCVRNAAVVLMCHCVHVRTRDSAGVLMCVTSYMHVYVCARDCRCIVIVCACERLQLYQCVTVRVCVCKRLSRCIHVRHSLRAQKTHSNCINVLLYVHVYEILSRYISVSLRVGA